MLNVERMTITLPADMAASVKGAVQGGSYASSSEVIREALREWSLKRAAQFREYKTLMADLKAGDADIAAGRVKAFSARRIVEAGRKKLKSRSRSA